MTSPPDLPSESLIGEYCAELGQLADALGSALRQMAAGDVRIGAEEHDLRLLRARLTELVAGIDQATAPGTPMPAEVEEGPTPRSSSHDLLTELALDHPPLAEGSERVLQGTNADMPLSAVFGLCSSAKKSGVLHVRTDLETIAFEFESGQIVGSATDTPGIDANIGELLVKRGAVERAALDAFVSGYDGSAPRFGQALLAGGLVDRTALGAALAEQFRRRFYRAFAAERAAYVFDERPPASVPPPGVQLDVAELLFAGAQGD